MVTLKTFIVLKGNQGELIGGEKYSGLSKKKKPGCNLSHPCQPCLRWIAEMQGVMQKFWEDDVLEVLNVSVLAFPNQLGLMGVCEPPWLVQGWNPGHFSYLKVLKTWKYNSRLFYTRLVLQNKQIASLKGTMIDSWTVENFFIFKMD